MKVGLSAKIETDLMHEIGEYVDSKELTIHQAVERLLRKALGQKINLDSFSDNDLISEAKKRNIEWSNGDMVSGKKAIARNRERTILEIVRRLYIEAGEIVSLNDVLTEAVRGDISRDVAEDLIDALCRDGRLMRPAGYETLLPL